MNTLQVNLELLQGVKHMQIILTHIYEQECAKMHNCKVYKSMEISFKFCSAQETKQNNKIINKVLTFQVKKLD